MLQLRQRFDDGGANVPKRRYPLRCCWHSADKPLQQVRASARKQAHVFVRQSSEKLARFLWAEQRSVGCQRLVFGPVVFTRHDSANKSLE